MPLTLPDTAALGDAGHITDHNLIVAALTQLDTEKAPKASPTFTGTPSAPTPASSDSSTTLATTAFVQAAASIKRIATQSFSAVSSFSVNNCFTSTYDNYRIVVNNTHSTEGPLLMRLRASGTDASTAYYSKLIYSRYDGTSVFGDAVRNNSDNLWVGAGALARGLIIDINGPAIAAATFLEIVGGDNNAGSAGGGRHATATAYDGFTLYVTAGTITGTVSVYGLAKA